jgi:hypothetical protein
MWPEKLHRLARYSVIALKANGDNTGEKKNHKSGGIYTVAPPLAYPVSG